MDRLAETMDRMFGSEFMSEVEGKADRVTRKPKRKSPSFTTPGKLAVNGKIPRWASPWVKLIHEEFPNFQIMEETDGLQDSQGSKETPRAG